MSIISLQKNLYWSSEFQDAYKGLIFESVGNQFSHLQKGVNDSAIIKSGTDWEYLLLSASVLAQGSEGVIQEAALRIAQSCIESGNTTTEQKDSALIVLDMLANQGAIELSYERNLVKKGVESRIRLIPAFDWLNRRFTNALYLSNGDRLEVNTFQRSFWDSSYRSGWLSVSAPTSAGKSFIIKQRLIEHLRKYKNTLIVYVVPTRALIQQVQNDLEEIFTAVSLENVEVSSLPRLSSKEKKNSVLVLTQERLHMLLGHSRNDLKVDLLLIDEAQKVGDSSRGILLQQAVDAVCSINQSCIVFFASPMSSNPEVLLAEAPLSCATESIIREDVTVNQNLLWVTQEKGKPDNWILDYIRSDSNDRLGSFTLPNRPATVRKRMAMVAHRLGDEHKANLVYVNGAAEAEHIAKLLCDLTKADEANDTEIINLIDLIKKSIHPNYALSFALKHRVAFHYGNMPLLVRSEIEMLFSKGLIKFLVCTSTLVEGVNLPCKNVFIRGPKKGKSTPMGAGDFWNLAGRAGRWGKEFQGNVICIDPTNPNVWKEPPPRKRSGFQIRKAANEALKNREEVLNFLELDTPQEIAVEKPELEQLVSFLVSTHLRRGELTKSNWLSDLSLEFVERLNSEVGRLIERSVIPYEVVLANPGISLTSMDALLSYFEDHSNNRKEPPESLLPVHPETENSAGSYRRILFRINKYLSPVFGSGPRVSQLSVLIVSWMQGHPLHRIIKNRINFYTNKNLGTNIRETMKDVEEFARFQAPKYISCYADILSVHFDRIGRGDLKERLLDYKVLLEFGVSLQTQISLIGLGLSRTSAISISELMSVDSLTEEECVGWIKSNEWMTSDLPLIIQEEVKKILRLS